MTHIDELASLGTSTWLDDLSRDRITSGNLAEVIENKSVVGVTTNPAIFAAAMSKGTAYDAQIAELKAAGAAVDEAVYAMSIDDVRDACDIFAPIYESTDGRDGRVSIEVDPRISEDREATLAQARELWAKVDRPNVMIKIPATAGSMAAITDGMIVACNELGAVDGNGNKVTRADVLGACYDRYRSLPANVNGTYPHVVGVFMPNDLQNLAGDDIGNSVSCFFPAFDF